MPVIMLKNKTLAFPALATPEKVGDGPGNPAYGARYPIDPKDPDVAALDAAILEAAREKWKDKAEEILQVLREEKLVCLQKSEYRSKKTGKVYGGFEGMYALGTRSEKVKPTAVDRTGAEVTNNAEIERMFYSGCVVHAKVEIWAQDNAFGRRINATTLGVMFAGEGVHFGGGSGAAKADDFAGLASEADDFV